VSTSQTQEARMLPSPAPACVVQFHVYLDDLFPRSIGRPISEWW
jgi:hypothetical protein